MGPAPRHTLVTGNVLVGTSVSISKRNRLELANKDPLFPSSVRSPAGSPWSNMHLRKPQSTPMVLEPTLLASAALSIHPPVRRRVSIIQFREEVHSRIEGQDMQLGLFHPASINATSWIVEWLSKAWHVVTLVGSTRRSFTALKATPGPLICCVLILD